MHLVDVLGLKHVIGLENIVLRVPLYAISIVSNWHNHVELFRVRVVNNLVDLDNVGVIQLFHDLDFLVNLVESGCEGHPTS